MKLGWSLYGRASLAALALFVVSMTAAMALYAGGSWLTPSAAAHSFWENFWCDLVREPAHNGQPNARAAQLATLGFTALAAALAPFWLELSRLLQPGPRRFVRFAGVAGALATAAVALVPSDRYPTWHAPFVLTAGVLGLSCGVVCAGWALRHRAEARLFAASSVVLLALALLNLALYIAVVYVRPAETIVLPASQKLATLALLVWMVAGLRVSASRPRP